MTREKRQLLTYSELEMLITACSSLRVNPGIDAASKEKLGVIISKLIKMAGLK